MTNSIIKNPGFATTPGVGATPGRPAVPARDVYEVQQVCGFTRVNSTGSAITGDLTGSAVTWTCAPKSVLVHYPATAAVAPTPGVAATSTDTSLGWTGGGRSLSIFKGDGYVQFQVRASVVGVIAGINLPDVVDAQYIGRNIDFAFSLTGGFALIVENGVTVASVGAYTNATIFKITRTGTTVVYTMNGTTVRTTTGASTAPGWLEVSLYSGGDEVFNPSLVQVSAADMTAGTATLAAVLPPLRVFAATSVYAELAGILAPLTTAMSDGLPAPSYATLNLQLPPLSAIGFGLTGETGSLSASLAPLKVFSATNAYAELAAVLLPLTSYIAVEPNDQTFVRETLSYGDATQATSTSDVSVNDVVTFSVAMTATSVYDLSITAPLVFDVAMTAMGAAVEDVNASDSFMLTVQMVEPGADAEVWATNIEGGSTRYVNFPFNSFAKIGDNYFGSAVGGVFRLGGDTDAGAPIRAVISPGKLAFGSAAKKTLGAVYLGLACPGLMAMKVKALDGMGAPTEYLYSTGRPSADLREARIKCGKGLRANFHTIELYNVAGTDFELASMQLEVADMQRKI